MSKGAFGGYDKPNFQVKNLTSDMWEPITTSNNFSAYTPEKAPQPKTQTPPRSTRQRSAETVRTAPTKEKAAKSRTQTTLKRSPLQTNKKTKSKA